MFRHLTAGVLAASLLMSSLTGCSRPEDWSDPEYIISRLDLGDQRAFGELSRLPMEERRLVVPKLIELYNRGLRRDQALEALVSIGDPAAREVFIAGLEGSDSQAAMAARGLAALEDRSSALAIAQRLQRVAQQDAFPGFLDSLARIPTSEAGDVVADIMMRPAQRIGGINTVRKGCEFLGMVDDPSDAVLEALVFGLVNFIPQPYEDALHACELALVQQRSRAVPAVTRLFNGENQTAINHLRSHRFRPVVGQLRAASVLSRMHTDAANEALHAWFDTPKTVPHEDLREMQVAEQQNWYDQNGQSFMLGVQALAFRGSADDLAMLRRLEATDVPNSALAHFSPWFALSAGAEFGLRTSVHEALAKRGSDDDRANLWARARTGTVSRGGAPFSRELRKNALHYIGRTARPGELAAYDALFNATAENERQEFQLHRIYFLLAETCGDDVACYTRHLDDASPLIEQPTIAAILGEYPEGNDPRVIERHEVQAALEGMVRVAAVWQLAYRFGDNAASVAALVERIGHPSLEVRMALVDGLLSVGTVPAGLAETVQTFIDSDLQNTAPPAREYRHTLRIVAALRGA
jgi:hypothetical protein